MEKAIRFEKPIEVRSAVGKEVCVTDWVTVDQQRIDKFAEATGDFQWIHVDVERAKASSYGGTIAHGFLTLSLLCGFYEILPAARVPILRPRLELRAQQDSFHLARAQRESTRARFVLAKVDEVDGGLQLTCNVTVEIEGQDKPALIAKSIVRRYLAKGTR